MGIYGFRGESERGQGAGKELRDEEMKRSYREVADVIRPRVTSECGLDTLLGADSAGF